MNCHIRRASACALLASMILSACGGGGGGGGGDAKSTGGAPTSGTPAATETPATVARDTTVDSDSPAAALSLTTTTSGTIENADVVLELATAGDALSTVKIVSGSLMGGNFFGPLVLTPSMPIPFSSSRLQDIGGVQVREYKASGALSAGSETHYFAAVAQVPFQAGFKYAGIGNWKYMGGQQYGYFSGQKIAVGAWTFGEKTPAANMTAVRSGNYAGFVQAAAEANRSTAYFGYHRNYDQATLSASASLDVASRTITLQFTNYKYWDNHDVSYALGGGFMDSAYAAGSTPSHTINCVGSYDPASNAFTCQLSGQAFSGKIKGRFFGPQAQEIAGTFVFEGFVLAHWSDHLSGGFLLKRGS